MSVQAGPNLIESGLVLNLDAANLKSYPGSGNTWTDLSGNGKNFTWSSTPSFTSDGGASCFNTLNLYASGPASNSFGVTNATGYCVMLACLNITLTNNIAFVRIGYFSCNTSHDFISIFMERLIFLKVRKTQKTVIKITI